MLPQKFSEVLLDQPETGEDLHVVSVTLKDGRVFEDVAISQCSIVAAVRGHAHVPFDARDVVQLRVTHQRWGLDRHRTDS
jgi:hypothetical protein